MANNERADFAKAVPFWTHFEDLRKTLIRCAWAIVCTTLLTFCFHKTLFHWILTPLPLEGELYILSPLEGFGCVVKLSLWMGIFLASPIWLYLTLKFLLPALKKEERKALVPFILLSVIFIGLGLMFAYKITIPLAIRLFQGFNAELGKNLWGLSQTIDFLLFLLISHGILFELYVLLLLLIHYRLLTYAMLKTRRKGVIVAIFIVAALLTPPDVVTQLLLALPLLLLFESALFYSKIKYKNFIRRFVHES